MSSEQIDRLQRVGYTLHLKTQRDQPYGSVRKCCEICGVMIYGEHAPLWTDDEQEYRASSARCDNSVMEGGQ